MHGWTGKMGIQWKETNDRVLSYNQSYHNDDQDKVHSGLKCILPNLKIIISS